MNTALIPVPKLEEDCYDWYARHDAILKLTRTLYPEIVLIGDSITHFWAGPPEGNPPRGPLSWQRVFGDRTVLNLGFGWDRTQNMLWRLDNGEFEGLEPKTVVIHAGTNNTSETENARANTPPEIAEGVVAIAERVRKMSPETRLVIMAVFPREFQPDAPRRKTIAEINHHLAPAVARLSNTTFLDITAGLLQPDGTISPEVMGDGTHPLEKGYAVWADALIKAGV
jgi:lysophospholipase L1-like esterase